MSPRQRIMSIRLAEKLEKNPRYAKSIGVEIANKKERTDVVTLKEV